MTRLVLVIAAVLGWLFDFGWHVRGGAAVSIFALTILSLRTLVWGPLRARTLTIGLLLMMCALAYFMRRCGCLAAPIEAIGLAAIVAVLALTSRLLPLPVIQPRPQQSARN